jgi:CDP-4-dehydro-6-deoxyglucose reductase
MRFTGPKGSFFIRKSNQPIILLASGTGFAPIYTMVQALIAENDKRDIYIYWRMRQANHFYIENPFSVMDAVNIKFIPFITDKDPQWYGRIGRINDILSLDFESLSGFSSYACGSAGFIEEAKKVCLQLQLNENDFYTDLFTPA